MNRSRRDDPNEADEIDEGPSQQDIERFAHVTRKCPACNKDVFDDSSVCYHCGHAFERTTAGSSKTPMWVVVTVAVLLGAFFLGTVTGLFRFF